MAIESPTDTSSAIATYVTNKVEGSTPGQLVLQTYDYIIACCRRSDWVRANKGIVELMKGLDLEHLEIAGPLWRIYEYCLDANREKRFEEVMGLLSELRSSWAQVVDEVETGRPAGTR
ncbi:MAG: flagellar export chaperone FliS [Candidatus Eisenbacteria bacterium]